MKGDKAVGDLEIVGALWMVSQFLALSYTTGLYLSAVH